MIDIQKQIDYWRNASDEDWEVACELVDLGRTRHGLFFAHLALEKMLKAHVCRATGDLAPKVHNLVRLAELANLTLSDGQRALLGQFNQYQLEGRYPELPMPSISPVKVKRALREAERMLEWLKKLF